MLLTPGSSTGSSSFKSFHLKSVRKEKFYFLPEHSYSLSRSHPLTLHKLQEVAMQMTIYIVRTSRKYRVLCPHYYFQLISKHNGAVQSLRLPGDCTNTATAVDLARSSHRVKTSHKVIKETIFWKIGYCRWTLVISTQELFHEKHLLRGTNLNLTVQEPEMKKSAN